MKRIALLLVGLLALFAATAQTGGLAVPFEGSQTTFTYDCSGVSALGLNPGELSVVLRDDTTNPVAGSLEQLQVPACRSVLGAQKEALARGLDAGWLASMPFKLVDEIETNTLQASFLTEKSGDLNPRVEITSSYLALATKGKDNGAEIDELTWTFGHELGHGVMEHSSKKFNVVKLTWLLATVLALIALVVITRSRQARGYKPGLVLPLVLTVCLLGVIVTAYLPVGKLMTPGQELASDEFGIRVLEQLGAPLPEVKKMILSHMRAVDENVPTFLDASPHPKKVDRIEAINGIQAIPQT